MWLLSPGPLSVHYAVNYLDMWAAKNALERHVLHSGPQGRQEYFQTHVCCVYICSTLYAKIVEQTMKVYGFKYVQRNLDLKKTSSVTSISFQDFTLSV